MVAISLILTIWLPLLRSFRIVFGSVFVLFLPGFVWTYVFFKKQDPLERVALSFALSIAIVPLVVFYANLLGMRITAVSVMIITMVVILAGILVRNRKKLLSTRQVRRKAI